MTSETLGHLSSGSYGRGSAVVFQLLASNLLTSYPNIWRLQKKLDSWQSMAMCQENSDSSEFRQAPTCSSMLIASRRDAFSPPGRPLGISHRDVSWYYHFWYYHYPQRDHPHKSWIASQYKDFLRHCFWFCLEVGMLGCSNELPCLDSQDSKLRSQAKIFGLKNGTKAEVVTGG